MPTSLPAPLVLHHPTEKGLISPASTPHLIECLPIHSSTTQTTRRSALLLCPHAASLLPPTKAPPYLGFFHPPSLRPHRRRTPTAIRLTLVSWFVLEDPQTFWLPPPFRFFPLVRIGLTIYFPLASVLSLSGCFNHLK